MEATSGGEIIPVSDAVPGQPVSQGHLKDLWTSFLSKYYDGSHKYKSLVWILGLSGVSYLIYRFWESCHVFTADRNSYLFGETEGDQPRREKSFIRGFVRKWWVPILETDFDLTALNEATTTHKHGSHEHFKNPKLWHYSEFEDYTMNFLETDVEINFVVEHSQFQVPLEVVHLIHASRVLGQYDKESMLGIWKFVSTVRLEADEILFQPGDTDDHLYVLSAGLMEVVIAEPKSSRMRLKLIRPGGQIYSILSFIDVITGNSNPIKSIEAKALIPSTIIKVPIMAFRDRWMEQPELLIQSVRRLIRRIYQVVFVALHKVLGLSSELIKHSERPPLNPEFLANTATDISAEETEAAILGMMAFFDLNEPEHKSYFESCQAIFLGEPCEVARAGSRTSNFLFVYQGELEVSQTRSYADGDGQDVDEVMFYVPAGEAVGGLSYLTDDVNIFNIRVPEKAIVVVMPGEALQLLYTNHPTAILKIANSIVGRLSKFTRQMDFGIEWTQVEAGAPPIYKVGDAPECTYLVLSGRLRSILHNKGKKIVIGEYGRNDWVGMVETLTQKKRTKTVLPVRDTELAKIPDGVLNLIKMKFPVVTARLLDFVGNRVAKSYTLGTEENLVNQDHVTMIESAYHRCSTVVLLPTTKGVPTLCVAIELRNAFQAGATENSSAVIITFEMAVAQFGEETIKPSNDYLLSSWLANFEQLVGLVIFVADPTPTLWSLKCIKQADIILILANAKESYVVSDLEQLAINHAPRAKKELVLLHNSRVLLAEREGFSGQSLEKMKPLLGIPRRTRDWLELRHWLSMHHHIKLEKYHFVLMGSPLHKVEDYFEETWEYDIHADFSRLARWITGSATGVVLGGGGAKGAAHVGLLRVILEKEIPIDLICGVSIGAFVGALYSIYQDVDKADYCAEDWFLEMTRWYQYIMDMTIPIVSFFKGEAFNNSLKSAFDEIQIEDMWLPYFCVSTDLTGSGPRVHRCGSLWRYCRASMGLVAYFPPMCDPVDGHYLLDGGYTNLVPANIMRDLGAKLIIAIDVSSEENKSCTNYGDQLSGFRVLMHKIFPFLKTLHIPNLFALQTQLAFVQSALYLDMVKKMDMSTVYLRPPIDEFSTADFDKYTLIKHTGHRFGLNVFSKCQRTEPLAVQWGQINPNAPQTKNEEVIEKLRSELRATSETESERPRTSTSSTRSHSGGAFRDMGIGMSSLVKTRRNSSIIN